MKLKDGIIESIKRFNTILALVIKIFINHDMILLVS